MRWSKLSEQPIRKAETEGLLDSLEGAGKPLMPDPGGADASGFRVMAEAGVPPREIGLPCLARPRTASMISSLGLQNLGSAGILPCRVTDATSTLSGIDSSSRWLAFEILGINRFGNSS